MKKGLKQTNVRRNAGCRVLMQVQFSNWDLVLSLLFCVP
jgi:hypothetical protein